MRKLSISELCMKLVTLIFIRPHIKPFGECRTHAASGQYADNVITINIFYEIFYRRPVTSTFTLVKKKNLSSAHSYEKKKKTAMQVHCVYHLMITEVKSKFFKKIM